MIDKIMEYYYLLKSERVNSKYKRGAVFHMSLIYDWTLWFAWYPVCLKKKDIRKICFLQVIERRKWELWHNYHLGMGPSTDRYIYDYRCTL